MIIQKTKLVEFFSDFNGFKVVMKNLNYDFIKNIIVSLSFKSTNLENNGVF